MVLMERQRFSDQGSFAALLGPRQQRKVLVEFKSRLLCPECVFVLDNSFLS